MKSTLAETYGKIIYGSPPFETAGSVNGEMDKENVTDVHTRHGILLFMKKAGESAACDEVGEP